MNRIFVYVCTNYWGSGKTIDEAKGKAREAGASRKDMRHFRVYDAPEGTTVDDGGNLCWWGEEQVAPRIIDSSKKLAKSS